MVMGYSRSGSSLVLDMGGAYVEVCSVIVNPVILLPKTNVLPTMLSSLLAFR